MLQAAIEPCETFFLRSFRHSVISVVPLLYSTCFPDDSNGILEPTRFARLIEEKKRAGARVLDLTESNPTRAGFDYPAEEILAALAKTSSMLYEPTPRGLPVAREAVAGYYAERGFDVAAERIHLTASTSEAYSFLFKLLADQGESILVPQPSYPLFEFLAALEGVELLPYELHYVHPSGWRIDFDSVEKAIAPNTRAIILVSPNNPTGSFTKLQRSRTIERCLRATRSGPDRRRSLR